jgi:hypothetical protein
MSKTPEPAAPDYAGLVTVLLDAKYLVDATGKVFLSEGEAARIRAFGFSSAIAGWWDVPPLPPELALPDRRLEHLAVGWPSWMVWTRERGCIDTRRPVAPSSRTTESTSTPIGSASTDERPISGLARDQMPSSRLRSDANSRPLIGPVKPGHFVSRTGRQMPIATRAAYHTPANRMKRHAENRRRLLFARNYFGKVQLRVVPQVRLAPDRPDQYGSLLGEALMLTFDEPVDVMDCWQDLKRFLRCWRPLRRRTDAARQAVDRLWEMWERLAKEVR